MQEIDFAGGKIRRVGSEDFENFVPGGHVNFQIELRLGVAEVFPGFANLAGLLFTLPLAGGSGNDRRGLQALTGAKNTVPQIVGGDDGEANGFATFFRQAERLREELLLDAAEELIGVEFLFTGGGAAQDANVKYDDIAATGLEAVENICEMVEIKLVADGDKDVARFRADGFGS